jgi:hypothetical protein
MTAELVSGPSRIVAPTVIMNSAKCPISLMWINHEGKQVSYGVLDSRKGKGLKTFVGHPWIFFAKDSSLRLTVHVPNRLPSNVLWPQALKPAEDGKARYFTAIVTFPSLRDICFQVLRDSGLTDDSMRQQCIPDSLKHEYKSFWPSHPRTR